MPMLVRDLRYPVALWTGAPPLHQITALALAIPQRPSATAEEEQQRVQQRNQQRRTAGGGADPLPLICSSQFPPYAFLLTGSQTGELVHWEIASYRTPAGAQRRMVSPKSDTVIRSAQGRETSCKLHD
jgi:hypothetical protein